jgi:hypothetical protein
MSFDWWRSIDSRTAMKRLLLIVSLTLGLAAAPDRPQPGTFYAKDESGSDVVVGVREFQFSTALDGQESSCEVP